MCKCSNIEFGDGNTKHRKTIKIPDYIKIDNWGDILEEIEIDNCLEKEVKELWELGIRTTGCCCGHKKGDLYKYIGVYFEDIPKMKALGYKVAFNAGRPLDEDSFFPKSV